MLLVKDENQMTPLDLAINSENPRCINLIMSMIAKGCSETIGKCTDLFSIHYEKMVEFNAFKEFIDSTFYKSDQFLKVSSLAVKDVE